MGYNRLMNYREFKPYGKKPGRIKHDVISYDGKTFDSKAEYERYIELRIMEKQGLISGLQVHPEYEIIPRQKSAAGNVLFRAAKYTADFAYVRDGKLVVEDVKSEYTRLEKDYVLRRKLMFYHNGIYVREVIK